MSLDETVVSFHGGWFAWVTDLFSERNYFLGSADRLFLFVLSYLTRNQKTCPASFFYTETGNYIGIISHHLYPILEKECGRNNIRGERNPTNQVHFEHLIMASSDELKEDKKNSKYVLIKFVKSKLFNVFCYNRIFPGIPGGASGKESVCQCRRQTQETWVPSLGWEDPLEEEMATHPSILAWKIPWAKELVG